MEAQLTSNEVSIFTRYYTKEAAKEEVVCRYQLFLQAHPVAPSNFDTKILKFALNRPWSIGYLDSGLAILSPHSELRRRLYITFALLESDTAYSNLFLAQKRSPFYIIFMFSIGVVAICKVLIGIFLIKVVLR